MKPAAIWIALTFGAGAVQVDVGGAVILPVLGPPVAVEQEAYYLEVPHSSPDESPALVQPAPRPNYRAFAVGPLILTSRGAETNVPDLLDHELEHVRQWEALGPAMPLAYGLSFGHGFEDYLADGETWEPEPLFGSRCPVVRWSPGAAPAFMPCWRF